MPHLPSLGSRMPELIGIVLLRHFFFLNQSFKEWIGLVRWRFPNGPPCCSSAPGCEQVCSLAVSFSGVGLFPCILKFLSLIHI